MRKGTASRTRSFTRKKLADLAGGLASAGNMAEFLAEKGMQPHKMVRALLSKHARGVVRDMRKLAAVQKYLQLALTKEEMEELCKKADEGCVDEQSRRDVPGDESEAIAADEATLEAAVKQMAEEEDDEE